MEKTTYGRALRSVLLTKYYSGNQIKKNGISRACSTYGREERCIQGFGGGNLREGDHLEDPGVDGSKILKWAFEIWDCHGLDRSKAKQGQVATCCKFSNEPSGSIK